MSAEAAGFRLHYENRLPSHWRVLAHDRIEKAQAGPVLQKALSFHQQGRLAEADALYRKIIAQDPRNADALHLLGVIEIQNNNPSAAIALIDRAIKRVPNNAVFLSNRGNALKDLKRFDEALASYDRALACLPDFAEALNNRGLVLHELKRFDEALESYRRSLAIKPNHAKTLNNRGMALRQLERFDEALASYDRALALEPNYAEALSNRGNTLRDLKRFEDALANYDLALTIKDSADALINRAVTLQDLKRFEEALLGYDRALAIAPDNARLFGARLFCKMNICDWSGLDEDVQELGERIASGQRASEPFFILATPLSAALQRKCAQIYARENHPARSVLPEFPNMFAHGRIRLGYFSSDFRNHPVADLSVALCEGHDRARFEAIAFSFGPTENDAMRVRLEKAFDRFLDVGAMSDKDIALLARSLKIDIAIDLNGFTQGGRPNIFAMKAAPIQVNYLGYPGTMGAAYMDYLIADPVLIPREHREYYAEKIAYLPDTYMPTQSMRPIAAAGASRAGHELPENGFVFCCFNNTCKLSPAIFGIRMRLLTRVAGSVLWLPQMSDAAMRNLKGQAKLHGVDPERLVFARFLSNPQDHLARLQLADLFLDTLPYNAHATACDALWAGLPILTCLGESFPGRVGASLLHAIGVPELITRDLQGYENLALELAANPEKLLALRRRLAANRLSHPLFDTARFTKHIESAYIAMWDRHRAGLAPQDIHVPPAPAGLE